MMRQLSAEMAATAASRSLLLVSVAALMLSSCPGPASASPAADQEQSEAPEEEDRPLSCTSAVAVHGGSCADCPAHLRRRAGRGGAAVGPPCVVAYTPLWWTGGEASWCLLQPKYARGNSTAVAASSQAVHRTAEAVLTSLRYSHSTNSTTKI